MLASSIAKHLGVRLSKASVCRLLVQMGLTAQRPLWRAYQQNPAAVRSWMEEPFPSIRAQAKRERAEIWFGDEAGVRSDAHSGTTWSPKGKPPIVSSAGARFGLNIISAVSRRGELRFMCVKGRVNSSVFIEFLKRMIHDAKRKVFLIVDGHPTKKAAVVTKFLEKFAFKIRLFLLPPYSPELNPDELVWNDLKNNCLGRKAIGCAEQLEAEVISFLRFLQKAPERIRSYFQTPHRSPRQAFGGILAEACLRQA
jgi:transposase